MILSSAEIIKYLKSKNSIDLSGKLFVYESIDSTSTTARKMALGGAWGHRTVVIANHQTAGKGRYGKPFFSPADCGLYISFVLDFSKLFISSPALITTYTAIMVCEVLEALSGLSFKIKWVNDIYLDDKKVCGILTEAVTVPENPSSQWIILGIGINLITPDEGFPGELQQIAGSVFKSGFSGDLKNRLASKIISSVFSFENPFDEKEKMQLYKQKMFLLDERIIVTASDNSYEAEAIDIDENGCLIVKKDNGKILTLSSGEISIRR